MSKPIRRIYTKSVLHHQQRAVRSDDDEIPEFHSIKSSFARTRQDFFPPISRRVRDVLIVGDWMDNWQGNRIVAYQNNNWGLVLFMSADNAKLLQKCQNVYVDGTFKTCPKPFHQVITIHGM